MSFSIDDEQIQRQHACAENPLAATLAKRFPVLLWSAVAVLTVNLLAILLVAFSEMSTGVGSWIAGNHWVVVVPTILTATMGAVLVVELRWMFKHQITPELVCVVKQDFTVTAPQKRFDVTLLQQPRPKPAMVDLRGRGYAFLNALQEEASAQRMGAGDERHSDAEVRRSWEILYSTMADLVLAGLRGIEEKREISPRETRPGWRHLEETLSIVKRLTSIVHQRAREVHRKSQPRPCKQGRSKDNGRRNRRHDLP